jgi:hypothetical protein
MKRASEVPPEVDNFGFCPVTSASALITTSVNGRGSVENTSAFEGSQSIRHYNFSTSPVEARCSTSVLSDEKQSQ